MSKWKSSKTNHFRRFQPKRISPSFSAHFFTYYSTSQHVFSTFFRIWHFVWHYNHYKVYIFDVLKAWDYAQTIFRSEKLQIAYIKAEIGAGKHSFLCFEDDCMVMHTVCILSMYHGYVSWLCIVAMYHGHVSWLCITAMYHGYVYYIIYITYYKTR